MTNNQVKNLVKLLLDDYNQVFHKDYLLDRYIDEAQLRLIRKAYMQGDERLLRPLYRIVEDLANGDLVEFEDLVGPPIVVGERVLYPKVCQLYLDNSPEANDRKHRRLAKYVERGLYDNYEYRVQDFFTTFGRFYYTLDTYKDTANADAQSQRHIIKFNVVGVPPQSVKARFIYIKRPNKFNSPDLVNAGQFYTLEIPEEYHPQLAFLAADMANSIDVLERDRGSYSALQETAGTVISKLGIGE